MMKEEAMAAYHQAVRNDPGDAWVYNRRGGTRTGVRDSTSGRFRTTTKLSVALPSLLSLMLVGRWRTSS
jgi:hypothetical protein